MPKFRKGDKIIATRPHSQTGDRSFIDDISEVLHKATHHYVLRGPYGNHIMALEDVEDRQFVKATKKMIELMKKRGD
ncbi:hypothetical protein KAR91_83940 [Candidatus Pacearchaeota archaeon]|nr:hypothetical protein [Candidatus Pacearchaeota archaeon]